MDPLFLRALTEGELLDQGLLMMYPRTDPKTLGLDGPHLDDGHDACGGVPSVDSTPHSTVVSTEPTLPTVQTEQTHHVDAARATTIATVTQPTRTRLRVKHCGKEHTPEHQDAFPGVTLQINDSPVLLDG